jgi:DNA-binding response OmpR family regulator
MNFCPRCGHNIYKDEPLIIGDWRIDPLSGLHCGAVIVPLTKAEATLCHSVAALGGRSIPPEALGNRVSDSEDANTAAVLLVRVRKKCKALGLECPIKTRWGWGYYWDVQS